MIFKRTLTSTLALAIALAFSPVAGLQAAGPTGIGSQPGSERLIETAKMKKASKKAGKRRAGKRKKARKAASKGSSCGAYMYRKKGKCVDARNKK